MNRARKVWNLVLKADKTVMELIENRKLRKKPPVIPFTFALCCGQEVVDQKWQPEPIALS